MYLSLVFGRNYCENMIFSIWLAEYFTQILTCIIILHDIFNIKFYKKMYVVVNEKPIKNARKYVNKLVISVIKGCLSGF